MKKPEKLKNKKPAKSDVLKKNEEKREQERTTMQKAAMVKSLRKSLGVVTPACEAVGIARSTHYEWMIEDPEYKKEVESMSEIALDFVESKLHQSISKGSDTAAIFYLKTKGKNRGFIERVETEHLGKLSISNDDERQKLKEKLSKMNKKDFEVFKKSNKEAQEILKKYE